MMTVDNLDAARALYDNGWHPIRVQPGSKLPADTGVTGGRGADWNHAQIVATDWAQHSLGTRMPDGVVGIDVDQYGDKAGWDDLEAARNGHELPELPDTWVSTARPSPSGIRFYRTPPGWRGRDLDGAVELIQRHHRYAMTWPSIHPKTGAVYNWVSPDGEPSDLPPTTFELARLPQPWLDHFADHRDTFDGRAPVEWENPNAAEPTMSPSVQRIVDGFHPTAAEGRHTALMSVLGGLVRLDERHHPGTATALQIVRQRFEASVAGEEAGRPHEEFLTALADTRRAIASTGATTPLHGAELDLTAFAPVDPQPEVEGRTSPRLDVLDETEIGALTPPKPLVPGWLYRSTLAALYAPPKAGKTFVALDIAMAVARGADWAHGPAEAAPVLYVAAEGVWGVGQRAKAWRQHHGAEIGDIRFVRGAVQLRNPVAVQALIDAAEGCGLIVLDTLARCAVGVEENSAKEMGEIVAALDAVKAATGACILVVHHTGKDAAKGMRGSNALDGALDTALVLEGDVKGGAKLSTRYQKDAEPADERWVRFDPTPIGSLVAVAGAGPTTTTEDDPLNEYRRRILSAIRRARGDKQMSIEEWIDRAPGAKSELRAAFKTLLDDGYFVEVGVPLTNARGESRVRTEYRANAEKLP